MNKSHFPVECTRLLIPVRENGEDSFIDRFIVAVLLHIVSVYWAYCVVGSETLRNNQVKSFVIGVLLCLNEVLDERKTTLSKLKVVERVIYATGCHVFNKRGSRRHTQVNE